MTTDMDYKICSRGLWDTTVPGIVFDEEGVSNYAKMFDKLCRGNPRGTSGRVEWNTIVERIQKAGKKGRYDCIVGISGGTDSSYLLHLLKKEFNLRPLAVTIDNGWNSQISIRNVWKMTSKLNIDLETYVIEWEEVKSVLKAYMKASLPWVDSPTDRAIKSTLYETANRLGIKYVLSGGDFRSEGKQPTEWTYSDCKQLRFLEKKFGENRLATYPCSSITRTFYLGYIKKISVIRPYNYLQYAKREAQKFLTKEYDWEYYGGHHHENVFTRFVIGYWLPKKFGIDKRIITLSAQVLSGEISRDEALEELRQPPYSKEMMDQDKAYVLKKLGLTLSEFNLFLDSPNKYFWDYPSNYPLLYKYRGFLKPAVRYFLGREPMLFSEIEMRNP